MPPPPEQTDRVDRLAPSAWVRTWRGAAGLTLAAGELEATFLPDLGLLGASLPHQGEELLAPWANRLADRRYRVEAPRSTSMAWHSARTATVCRSTAP